MKKAILVAGFGTSCTDALENGIAPVEAALARAYPDREVLRAFTSSVIVEKLRSRGMEIEEYGHAVKRLKAKAYDEIAVVSTHLIRGREYEKLLIPEDGLRVSAPLLDSEQDLCRMARLLDRIAEAEQRPLLVMGHGAAGTADETYVRLKQKLGKHVFLACCEGSLHLENAMAELEKLPGKKLCLMPLMLAAGMHARKMLDGQNAGSWTAILQSRGFDVQVRMQGLGALEDVQQIFLEKADAILN